MARLLAGKGADINVTGGKARAAFDVCLRSPARRHTRGFAASDAGPLICAAPHTSPSQDGATPLLEALGPSGSPEVALALLELGADPNIRGKARGRRSDSRHSTESNRRGHDWRIR